MGQRQRRQRPSDQSLIWKHQVPDRRIVHKSPSRKCHSSPCAWVEYLLLSSCSELWCEPSPPRVHFLGSEFNPCLVQPMSPMWPSHFGQRHQEFSGFRPFLGGFFKFIHFRGRLGKLVHLWCLPSHLACCLPDKALSKSPCIYLAGGMCVP